MTDRSLAARSGTTSISVSVVVPFHNPGCYLRTCIQSLQNQTLQGIEFILVDDASIDGSSSNINDLVVGDSRFRRITLEKNVGAYRARAEGVMAARGAYIGFVDADDTIEPRMYEVLEGVAKDRCADIVICEAVEVAANGKENFRAKFGGSTSHSEKLLSSFCSGQFGTNALWNKLYDRELIRQFATLPFRWRQDISEDTIINIGCFNKARHVVLVDQPLYRHAWNETSVTRDQDRLSIYIQLFRAYALTLEQYPELSEDCMQQITVMFGHRLHKVARGISSLEMDEKEKVMFLEGIDLAASIYPQGLLRLMTSDWRAKHVTGSLKGALTEYFLASRNVWRTIRYRC
ncbi:glycosyltransferase [Pseudohalioglobus sediminis]|uniref:Glycosyltransferase n=1 Tax=Pseudohalioglobus sediminis TaxID=2606449 RepID=A0A5B0WPX4_9GAMM|nr:glycosyltransferase [Pseudohalioglobus sediminis]KAA1188836.1 glycosyltransferase [Pseudohalioglobus sediminis]